VHTHFRELRRYLDSQGVATTLVTPFSWGGPLRYPVFGVRRLLLDPWSTSAGVLWHRYSHRLFLRAALRRRLRAEGPCVVYAQDPLSAKAALAARRGPHQQVVMAVHFRISQADEYADSSEMARDGRAFRAVRGLEREVIPRVDRLVYVTRWAQDALLGWLPEASVVPSQVISNFVTAPDRKAKASPGQEGDLVSTGRLEPAKNHRFLLDVLVEARRLGHTYRLDIFGDGPSREALLAQVSALGLGGHVRLRGFRPDVRDLLPGYRAYVHASYSESQGLAIIEAMAAGLPVVTGDIGGIGEVCDDGVEARFWPLDDPATAAATLVGLLDDTEASASAARAAADRFHRDFDAAAVAPKLVSFVLG
jgi:glycosyltransferase involved in cell wall biosynthesis